MRSTNLNKRNCLEKAAQSLFDYLLQVMPELGDGNFRIVIRQKDDPNADSLYSLWQNAESKISNRKFMRPPTMSEAEISALETSGLIELHGKHMKITDRGADAIRSKILSDDTFALEKESTADGIKKVASIQSRTMADWYRKFMNGD